MVMGGEITLIDSAEETARDVRAYMEKEGMMGDSRMGEELFEVTDSPDRFAEVGRIFLDHEMKNIQHVSLEEE